MNKQFEYRGFNFNIEVEFDTEVEKKINSERYHILTINCLEIDNYCRKEKINDKFFAICVQDCERLAKKYIDEKLSNKISFLDLSKLGFK